MRFKTITLFSLLAAFGLLLTVPAGAQDQTPFFSEDFAGGLPADWSNIEVAGDDMPTSIWFHTTAGPTGAFAIDPLESTTADNGWMIFDSDLNCSQTGEQDAWLISPAIDASGQSEVFLRFQTFYRRFNDLALVRVGTDLNDLGSWSEYNVFPGLSNNDFGGLLEDNEDLNPQPIVLDLTADMAGESEVYFAFQFLSDMTTVQAGTLTGCAYSWQVDDVELFDSNPLPANDLTCSVPAYGPHYATPESQVDSIFFAFTVRNAGLEDQTNVQFLVTVEGDGGQFFLTQETLDVFPAGVTDTIVFEEPYVPEGQGIYTVTYTVSQDEDDARPDNNLVQAEFQVTEDIFANDNGGPFFSTQPSVETETYEMGCYYPIVAGGYETNQIDFSVASDDDVHIGEMVTVWLYQFVDDGTGSISDDTMIPVGAGTYTFGEDDVSGSVITATIEPLLGSGDAIELEEGADYFAAIEYNSETMRFVFSQNNYPYGQLAIIIREGSTWFTGFIGGGIIPLIRMRIQPIGGNAVSGVELLDASVKTFPNPATDLLNARVELPEVAEQLQVRIIDVYGKTHLAHTYENFLQDNFEFDTSRLPAGTYYLHLETGQGVKTEKIVIQR